MRYGSKWFEALWQKCCQHCYCGIWPENNSCPLWIVYWSYPPSHYHKFCPPKTKKTLPWHIPKYSWTAQRVTDTSAALQLHRVVPILPTWGGSVIWQREGGLEKGVLWVGWWWRRGGICHSRHSRRECKIFASGVNFSRNNAVCYINESKKLHFILISSLKLLTYY